MDFRGFEYVAWNNAFSHSKGLAISRQCLVEPMNRVFGNSIVFRFFGFRAGDGRGHFDKSKKEDSCVHPISKA